MKPHFRFKGGVWSCASYSTVSGWILGMGYTVREAWNDWKKEFA